MVASTYKTSIYVILARNAPTAVIFRRGPTKMVRLIKWNTAADTFENGQWFKGRIYERQCDLSPSGDKLVYLASNQKPPHYTWTAISKPPYLTALALWPTGPWFGGGRFLSDRKLRLYYDRAEPAKGFSIPAHFVVEAVECDPGSVGEVPAWLHEGCLKYGWSLAREGKLKTPNFGSSISYPYESPRILSRDFTVMRTEFRLRSKLTGIGERNGDWYMIEYEVENLATADVLPLGRLGWADWDRNGDLLYARGGKLFRWPRDAVAELDQGAAREIADFSDQAFEPVAPPEYARRW